MAEVHLATKPTHEQKRAIALALSNQLAPYFHVVAVAGQALPAGTFAEVRVVRAAPHHLAGELVAVTARPRHKTRIPVAAV